MEKIDKIFIDKDFEGYIWESDKTAPQVYDHDSEELLDLSVVKNPFVVEALFYNGKSQESYSVKFADGRYIAMKYDLKGLSDKAERQCYISNRIPGVRQLMFMQDWKPSADPLCEGMEVLQPAEFVFVGFKK